MAKRKLTSLTRAKNHLRPYFNAPKQNVFTLRKGHQRNYWKSLQAVRRETPASELSAILALVEENRAYPFQGLGNTFPSDPGTAPNMFLGLLKPLGIAAELNLQIARLNYHVDRLVPALESLSRINTLLVHGDLDRAKAAISAHKAEFGHSVVIAKKELLVGLLSSGHAGLVEVYRSITSEYRRTAWSVICHYIYDVMDPTIDPIRAGRIWLNIGRRRMETDAWYSRILEQEILGAPATETGLADTLLRYSAVSLLDMTLFIWRVRHVFTGSPTVDSSWGKIGSPISRLLMDSFSELLISVPAAYRRSSEQSADIELYRVASFFDDVANIAEWRASLSRLAFPESFEPRARHAPPSFAALDEAVRRIVEDPDRAAQSTQDLHSWESQIMLRGGGVSDQHFLAAILASESLSKIDGSIEAEQPKLTSLIAKNTDIFQYVPMFTLGRLVASPLAVSDPLLHFLLRDLVFRKARNDDNELERRLAFMKLFKGQSRREIVPYFELLYAQEPSLALLLARTCTRTFLERLFSLMSSVKDVLETRLQICEWLASATTEPDASLKEERDAVERELANLDTRSDLDSTRVHVDEEAFREWFDETQAINVARYAQTVLAEGSSREYESLLSYVSSTQERLASAGEDLSADTNIGSEFLLLGIVDASLKAFSTDRTFGLDSYLSRRIRHGTLNGHVMTPINRVFRRLAEKAAEVGAADSCIDSLIAESAKYLRSALDHARKDVIQIQSPAHPEGLIRVTWRTSVNIKYLDAMFARVRERVLETKGTYDPFPDIYALAWDCLEPDLAHLRLYMARSFLPAATAHFRDQFQALSENDRKIVYPFWVELGQTLEARVLEICGWFIRPVFRRDKYDLRMLINSSLSIVRDLNDEAGFTEEVVMYHDVPLSRGSFEVVGDALFVLLGNAARHGKPNGEIRIRAAQQDAEENMALISVESQVSTIEEFRAGVARIKTVFEGKGAELRDRAAVEEGFSGLGKLLNILQKVKSTDAKLRLIANEHSLSIAFEVTVPTEISFSRERG